MRAGRRVLVGLVWALCATGAATAGAQPASGPRETIDQGYSTTQPGVPAGLTWSASYHAAGDPKGQPPYLRRMVFIPPPGFHYDTSVPDRCTASDLQLSVQGPDACPAGSRIGTGTAEGIFYEPFRHDFVVDNFQHTTDVLNGDGEQIILVKSEGYTVVRGQIHPDGSIEFNPTTCFPAPPTGQCPDDYILQLKSTSVIPAYTKAGRSYATTPPTCPADGFWSSTVRFWWADGAVDSVVSRQPCAQASATRVAKRRRSHGRSSKPHSRRRARARSRSSSTS
jgi:hypothetical protein